MVLQISASAPELRAATHRASRSTTDSTAGSPPFIPWDLLTPFAEWARQNEAADHTTDYAEPRLAEQRLVQRAFSEGANAFTPKLLLFTVPELPLPEGEEESLRRRQTPASTIEILSPRARAARRLPPLRSEALHEVQAAAARWDTQHAEHSKRARKHARHSSELQLAPDGSSPLVPRHHSQRAPYDFRAALIELRRQRFVAPDANRGGARAASGWKKKKKPFDVYQSIWRPRMFSSDSQDLYESEHVIHARMQVEWDDAYRRLGAMGHIRRFDDDAKEAGRESEQSQEVLEVFKAHHATVSSLFTHYAATVPSVDILTLAAWRALVHDCGLVHRKSGGSGGRACTWQHLETVFMEADGQRKRAERSEEESTKQLKAMGRAIPATEPRATLPRTLPASAAEGSSPPAGGGGADRNSNIKSYLSRVDFLPALLKVSINTYILSKETSVVSKALDQLLTGVLSHFKMAVAPDIFRRDLAYTEPVCNTLKRHEAVLRRCFCTLATVPLAGGRGGRGRSPSPGRHSSPPSGGGGGSPSNPRSDAMTISIEGWMHACRTFRLTGVDLSERDAVHVFMHSRCTSSESPCWARGQRRDSCIPFEGFMEVCCHLATVKAIPSDLEIKERLVKLKEDGGEPAGERRWDAGTFLLHLLETDPAAYDAFLGERRRPWPRPREAERPEDFAKRLEHLVAIIDAFLSHDWAQVGKDTIKLKTAGEVARGVHRMRRK